VQQWQRPAENSKKRITENVLPALRLEKPSVSTSKHSLLIHRLRFEQSSIATFQRGRFVICTSLPLFFRGRIDSWSTRPNKRSSFFNLVRIASELFSRSSVTARVDQMASCRSKRNKPRLGRGYLQLERQYHPRQGGHFRVTVASAKTANSKTKDSANKLPYWRHLAADT
jgi:hypothetical protein